jgi:hypothetical protein
LATLLWFGLFCDFLAYSYAVFGSLARYCSYLAFVQPYHHTMTSKSNCSYDICETQWKKLCLLVAIRRALLRGKGLYSHLLSGKPPDSKEGDSLSESLGPRRQSNYRSSIEQY